MAKTNPLPGTQDDDLEPKMAPKVIVDVGMTDEMLLDCDSKGMFLCFAAEPGSFKELSDETYKSLSAASRAAYVAIREVHTKMKNYDPSGATPGIEFGEQFATGSSAYNQIHDTKLKPGLVRYFSRPDLIEDRGRRGWRKPRPGEVLHTSAPAYKGNSEGLNALRMKDGQVESVLLVKDADQDLKDRIARDKKREAMGETIQKATAEAVAQVTKGPTQAEE